jgi:uncharacterized protein DUF6627
MNNTVRKTLVALLIASTASFGLATPAQADVHVRDTAHQQLITRGVNPAEAYARIAAMTDEEAAAVAQDINGMPAGAGGGDGLVFAAVVLLGVFVLVQVLPYIIAGGVVIAAINSPSRTDEGATTAENQ